MNNKNILITIAILIILGVAGYLIANNNSGDQGANVSGIPDYNQSQNQLNMDTNQNNEQNMENTAIAQKGDTVMVHYTGKLTDGTVFDSSIGRGQPFGFVLGAGMVIPGWEKGILGMKVGEKKTLTIAPEDAYGAQGIQNPATGETIIPANATLVFDVELVDIKR